MSDESPELLAAIATAREAMDGQPADREAQLTPRVPAGQVVVIHARWSHGIGAQECVGIFKAVRDFDPVQEHAHFARTYPAYGPPATWTPTDRSDWAHYSVSVAGFLEPIEPTYLFLEPWPEKPGDTQD